MYSYEEVIGRIERARRFGKLPGVDATAKALKELGDPQEGMRFVHVAGTNGKGSTCAFLERILRGAGEKTGLFTSPHLTDFRERIRINGGMIDRESVTRLGNRLLALACADDLTMFDYGLLMAVLFFRENACDVAIFETGLGGRLDATNALGIADVAVITRIGMDHMSVLGDTIEQIAAEKAGILKPGSVFVMGPQEPAVQRVLIDEARRAGVGSIHRVTEGGIQKVRARTLRMQGAYQYENAATAMLTAASLLLPAMFACVPDGEEEKGLQEVCDRMDEICYAGLEAAEWPGRMELLSKEPFLLIDAAHNVDGARALANSLRALYPNERFCFVMGVMADKDYRGMLREIAPLANRFWAVTPPGERALPAKELEREITEITGLPVRETSAEELCDRLPREEKTIAFGSIYLLGELRGRFVR